MDILYTKEYARGVSFYKTEADQEELGIEISDTVALKQIRQAKQCLIREARESDIEQIVEGLTVEGHKMYRSMQYTITMKWIGKEKPIPQYDDRGQLIPESLPL